MGADHKDRAVRSEEQLLGLRAGRQLLHDLQDTLESAEVGPIRVRQGRDLRFFPFSLILDVGLDRLLGT